MKHKKIEVSKVTGLTATQENACKLLASGESVESTAQRLGIEEHTLSLWQRNKAFNCYYNLQRKNRRNATIESLYSLADEAIGVLRQSLSEITSEATRLKAATYIIDKLQALEVGETDIREAVKRESTKEWGEDILVVFDKEKYEQTLQEIGIEEQDYNDTLQ